MYDFDWYETTTYPCDDCMFSDDCTGKCEMLLKYIARGRGQYRYPEEDPAIWQADLI